MKIKKSSKLWKNKIKILVTAYKYDLETDANLSFTFSVIHNNKYIGYMSVYVDDAYKTVIVSGVKIDKDFRNRGLGRYLYEYAMKYCGQLSSHFKEASLAARTLWQNLIKNNKHTLSLRDKEFFKVTIYHKTIKDFTEEDIIELRNKVLRDRVGEFIREKDNGDFEIVAPVV